MSRLFCGAVLVLSGFHGQAEEHAYPDFSPDGTYIAFSSDRSGNHDLYTVRSDGSQLTLLVGKSGAQTQPTWSPDGESIAYVDRPWNPAAPARLMIIAAGGGQARRVGELRDVYLPHWASDGRIYFSMNIDGYADVFSVLPNGNDLVNHTNTPNVEEANVDVAKGQLVYDVPDGESNAIEMLDLFTGQRRTLLTGGIYWDPVFLPDGNLLVGKYPNADATRSVLTEFEVSGKLLRQWSADDDNVFWPAVSPDGGEIVFSLSQRDFGVGVMYRLTRSSGKVAPIAISIDANTNPAS